MKASASTPKQSLGDRVYSDLRNAITLGEIRQGVVFNEADLIARYKVSSSPLREALTRLRQDGLVRVIARRGYAVTELSLKDFHELIQMRLIIEGAAAELAAPRITDAHIAELRRLSNTKLVVDDKASYRNFMQANQDFHERIAEIADNGRLCRATSQIFDEIQRLLFADIGHGDGDELEHDHDEIIEALALRDGRRARSAVIRHIKQSRDRVVGRMIRQHKDFEDSDIFN
ncbi:GntR family transcriptional regulator [Rhizobium subbaraonis]|uniref:GntR family transcriptional regulator n=1 Tax=Rhizobium subbaraonis TaxID=908946 RepID=A0A285V2E3_9HYPH|nr:GntR family transcriptional regulator [Rhizobium subbaraonis]SOC48230.1 GntR family transcriptional regulator [Rhizobium subbaraonis]